MKIHTKILSVSSSQGQSMMTDAHTDGTTAALLFPFSKCKVLHGEKTWGNPELQMTMKFESHLSSFPDHVPSLPTFTVTMISL